MDPLFEEGTGNCHLQSSSPCIDAGDPSLPLDPDGTIADMGALYYNQGPMPPWPCIAISADSLRFGSAPIGSSVQLPLTIYNVGQATLVLYDIYTSETSFSADFNPADSLIAPNDSLPIAVIFSPRVVGQYEEILSILNNDAPVGVYLIGVGDDPLAADPPQPGILRSFTLYPPYPNPFNPMTTFKVNVAEATDLRLVVLDSRGRRVATLVNGRQPAGSFEITFNAADLASGVYFYHLRAGSRPGGMAGPMVLAK